MEIQNYLLNRYVWNFDQNGIYLIHFGYACLTGLGAVINLDQRCLHMLDYIRDNNDPSKIQVFGLGIILNTLSMRGRLARRGMFRNDHCKVCVLYFSTDEDLNHLSVWYPFAINIWESILSGIQKDINHQREVWIIFFGSLIF